jgi:hypothetical protein
MHIMSNLSSDYFGTIIMHHEEVEETRQETSCDRAGISDSPTQIVRRSRRIDLRVLLQYEVRTKDSILIIEYQCGISLRYNAGHKQIRVTQWFAIPHQL